MSDEKTYNAALRVERNMTEDEKNLFLDRVTAINPHLRGAHITDILEMLYDGDAYLAYREADEFIEYRAQGTSFAVIVAVVLLDLMSEASDPPQTPPDEMIALVHRLAPREGSI
jgi:hypothetical protein